MEVCMKDVLRPVRAIGRGIRSDIRRRLPYYLTDWTDAWNYRTVPATVYMFFCNILPAIAFAQDMFDRTEGAFGVNEVLMGSALGGVVFGLLAGQPLCIVGVTGPTTIFLYTIFHIIVPKHVNYFAFVAWVNIWSFIMHSLLALTNAVRYMRYVTQFSCDIFGCFINIIYIEKGIQILIKQFNSGDINSDRPHVDYSVYASAMFQIVTAMCVLVFGLASVVFSKTRIGYPWIRKFVADYSLPLIVTFFSGFTFFPGRIRKLQDIERLPIQSAFQPSESSRQFGREHGWFIHFWNIRVGYVFLAIPFAILQTLLYYFDHNISSIMAQQPKYVFKKPTTFHWDFFLLGCTTLVAGFLGIPAPNGLIPQAPLHVDCLALPQKDDKGRHFVLEQRFSNFMQGFATIGLMTGPLLKVLHCVPEGVLAGLFFMMGLPGLLNNELIRRLCILLRDPEIDRRLKRDTPADTEANNVKDEKTQSAHGSLTGVSIIEKRDPSFKDDLKNVNNDDPSVNECYELSTYSKCEEEVIASPRVFDGATPNEPPEEGVKTNKDLNPIVYDDSAMAEPSEFQAMPAIDVLQPISPDPLFTIPRITLFKYLLLSAIGVAGEVGISQTIAAIGFPGVLFVLLIGGHFLSKLFPNDIDILDAPAADAFVMGGLEVGL